MRYPQNTHGSVGFTQNWALRLKMWTWEVVGIWLQNYNHFTVRAYSRRFFVDPDIQGKGGGRSLVNQAVQLQDTLDVEVFERNAIGWRFYDRYGFVPVGQSYHDKTGQTLIQIELI
jgi:GNAT superfamily N-acetyltransferase